MLTLCKLKINHSSTNNMNNKISYFLSIIIFTPIALFANKTPMLVTTLQGANLEEVSMNLEIDGAIKLYSVVNEDDEGKEIIHTRKENAFTNWVLHPYKYFYIGTGSETEMITLANYKRLVKKYFTATPELIKLLGKRGFRYKNLPSMILYHNKKVTDGSGLTKEDIIASH